MASQENDYYFNFEDYDECQVNQNDTSDKCQPVDEEIDISDQQGGMSAVNFENEESNKSNRIEFEECNKQIFQNQNCNDTHINEINEYKLIQETQTRKKGIKKLKKPEKQGNSKVNAQKKEKKKPGSQDEEKSKCLKNNQGGLMKFFLQKNMLRCDEIKTCLGNFTVREKAPTEADELARIYFNQKFMEMNLETKHKFAQMLKSLDAEKNHKGIKSCYSWCRTVSQLLSYGPDCFNTFKDLWVEFLIDENEECILKYANEDLKKFIKENSIEQFKKYCEKQLDPDKKHGNKFKNTRSGKNNNNNNNYTNQNNYSTQKNSYQTTFEYSDEPENSENESIFQNQQENSFEVSWKEPIQTIQNQKQQQIQIQYQSQFSTQNSYDTGGVEHPNQPQYTQSFEQIMEINTQICRQEYCHPEEVPQEAIENQELNNYNSCPHNQYGNNFQSSPINQYQQYDNFEVLNVNQQEGFYSDRMFIFSQYENPTFECFQENISNQNEIYYEPNNLN